MGILDRFRDRMHPEPEDIAGMRRMADNRARLIATDPDAARILTIDPTSTLHSLKAQTALSEQITEYVATKHANGQPYNGLFEGAE